MIAPSSTSSETWYVVQTKPRQEFRARDHLERQGFRCVLPLLRVERMRRRIRIWVDEPLFARYLFIETSGANPKWHLIRSTRGVAQVVRFGGVPAIMPAGWIQEFQALEKAPVRLFEPGQRIRITEGAFAGIEGVYQLHDGDERAVVLLEMLGRSCKASFRIDQLRRVA